MNTKRKKTKIMSIIWSAFLVVITSVMAISFPVCAEGTHIIGTIVHDGSIYVYVRGISEVKPDSTIQIGNTICPPEQTTVAKFSDLDISMRTIVLIDNSKSIPDKNHADIQEILSEMIADAMETEQFKIGTISNELTWLCDYTNDHEMLNSVVKGIVYCDQDTYLSDMLYEVMTELGQEDTYACTRILIISDGADDKYIGYTNEEIRSRIEENAYSVYCIGIPAKNNSDELETMFSFSRAAKTEYFLLDGTISNEEIVDELLLDQNGICLKITPDESLKDGGDKNILLKLNTPEGSVELVAHAEMPFGTGTVELENETAEKEDERNMEEVLPTLSVSNHAEEEKDSNAEPYPWIFAGAGAAMALALVFVIFVFLKKKDSSEKNKIERKDVSSEKIPEPQKIEPKPTKDTQISSQVKEEDEVKPLWTHYYLKLKNLDKPNLVYKVPMKDKIHIGREHGEILIDDNEVSRKHCVVILRESLLYIKDTGSDGHGSKNGTYYENVRIHDETPIVSGGKIRIGSCNYQIELVEE